MSASTAFANDLLIAVFKSQTFGPTYIALHTADTGPTGNQTTSEATYGGYARKLVAPASWDASGADFENGGSIEFGEAMGGAGSILTHFTIGNAATGAGKVLLRGKLVNPVTVTVGQELRFKPGDLTGSVSTAEPV
ncbi:MAG: phage tail fiber protein [Stenotrophomonas acidaminiphila]